jgi:hypothetical protein
MEGFVHGQLADGGISLPPQDAEAIDPGNPRRFLRSIKWTKAMEGFVHGQLADGGISLPPQDAEAIDPGNPRRFLRSIKWTKAMEGFGSGHRNLRILPAPSSPAG